MEALMQQGREYDGSSVIDIGEKTGLGSSAAMSVAFTAGMWLVREWM